MSQQSKRHHYVPVFYLSRWEINGHVCEYSRPHREVVARIKPPTATGFERDLYTVRGFPAERRTVLEDVFFRKVDQIASDALDVILDQGQGPAKLPPKLRDGWSRFILSLNYRSPTRLAALKERYNRHVAEEVPAYEQVFKEMRAPSDGRSFEEFCDDMTRDAAEKSWAELFRRVVDSEHVGEFLNQMIWNVVTITGSDRSFLTSDHPIVMTNGLDRPDGHLVLPVGPSSLFVATKTTETLKLIKAQDVRQMQSKVNDQVVRQAQRFVYGKDDRQKRFVENRLVQTACSRPPAAGAPLSYLSGS
ncbi:DUF4238 domain-containing protein [Roseomonas sp. AR75]|uniref:DUF4238 domain-containing protein n=1 Tax=Roseomonas sp. AR75 TaxID=2562311 RepID=UPI0010C02540|nr:DUF4238 domain-containing protein [Roseomonas sp. AR75]